MAKKLEEHTRRAITNGKATLPAELSFLARIKFSRIAERNIERTRTWFVEVNAGWLKELLIAKRKLAPSRSKIRELMKDNKRLAHDVAVLHGKLARLQAANDQLMKNIDEDRSPDYFKRGPKGYFAVADERAFTPTSFRAFQGGSAGLEKK